MMQYDKKNIIIAVLVLVLLWFCWDVFTNVHDVTRGIDRVESDIRAAREHQQSATESIGRVETGLGIVEERIESSTETVKRIEENIGRVESGTATNQQLIGRGQQILATIKARGQIEN